VLGRQHSLAGTVEEEQCRAAPPPCVLSFCSFTSRSLQPAAS
jgi:hypothetical protein